MSYQARLLSLIGLFALLTLDDAVGAAPRSPGDGASGIVWRTEVAPQAPASGVRLPDAAVDASLAAILARPGARHFVVRFDQPVTRRQREQLQAGGVLLLDYLGADAYFAAALEGAQPAAAAGVGIRAVDAIEAARKLHPQWANGAPLWAVVGNERHAAGGQEPVVVANVLFFDDVSPAETQSVLQRVGATVLSQLRSANVAVVQAPLSAINQLAADDFVQWIEPPLPALTVGNDSNRAISQANQAQAAPYNLDGGGVRVMVYDGGAAHASHLDFGGRLVVRDGATPIDHATHVAGTLGGDGARSGGVYRGMAPGVLIDSFGFNWHNGGALLYTNPGDIEENYDEAINALGVDMANNSLASNTCNNGLDCEITGDYGLTSHLFDAIVAGSLGRSLPVFFANGNERSCTRCREDGVHTPEGYHSTAPPACAKNLIAIGALNSNNDSMTAFSSWGPTDDGRLKPDFCGPGCQSNGDNGVTSCFAGGQTFYAVICGTSMATPTVTGLSALLLQDYRAQFPGRADPINSTYKALLAHNAQDVEAPGPDFKSGYGSVRIRDTIDFVRSDQFIEAQVDQGESRQWVIVVEEGDPAIKITAAWDDVPATPNVQTALVNDLDVRLRGPDGSIHWPWTLVPSNPGLPAIRIRPDRLNNMEQVYVEAAAPGVWIVEVAGYSVPEGPQTFSLCSSHPLTDDCDGDGLPDGDQIAADPSLDCTSNGLLDACEPDCDHDGTADSCAILAGASDCDVNGVPDVCETNIDCNATGVYDACDIRDGISTDCNANLIPDECDISSGISTDCNGNMTPDECEPGGAFDCDDDGVSDLCEIQAGAADCNGNAAPDACDMSTGASGDCNANGTPDECDIAAGLAEDCDGDGIPDSCMAGFQPAFELADLHGDNGFVIRGTYGDSAGWSVSTAGDLNNDGVDDLVIGALHAAPNGLFLAGEVYVWFGRPGLGDGGVLHIADLDGANGFRIQGAQERQRLGWSVASAGDINADGIDDIVVGGPSCGSVLDFCGRVGAAYVIFGSPNVAGDGAWGVDALNGTNGFAIYGVDPQVGPNDNLGRAVAGVGDINGDGHDDLLIGAPGTDSNGQVDSGAAYVLLGGPGVGAAGAMHVAELDGLRGFVLRGEMPADLAGISVSAAGDVNGDGKPDLMIGAYGADHADVSNVGKAYVVFGSSSIGSTGFINLSSLNGHDGFVAVHGSQNAFVGWSVAGVGDLNADGYDDVLAGAPNADPPNNNFSNPGAAYVIFGAPDVGSTGLIQLLQMQVGSGFTIAGDQEAGFLGTAAAGLGDFSGDGIDDLLVARFAGAEEFPPHLTKPGRSYLLFGDSAWDGVALQDVGELNGADGVLLRGVGDDWSGASCATAGDLNADGLPDLAIGAPWGDANGSSVYVVFGRRLPNDCNDNGRIDVCDVADGLADCNDNGVPDSCLALEDDCNQNGEPDACDIASGRISDCNANGIPDDCEPDCNNNGVADGCDIAGGASADCTSNGIPDECEPDCNSNGIADSCDIAGQTSEDCSFNGVPDECESDCNLNGRADSCDIAAGDSEDCARDGTPDECEVDCNENNRADSCDLVLGFATDENGNGVLDVCEEAGVYYVDDNAPNDPGHGDPAVGDPDENGSFEHPFDSIQEAVDVSVAGDEIVVAAGVYTGAGNREIDFQGREILLRSSGGPESTIIDAQAMGRVFSFHSRETSDAIVDGFTIRNGLASQGGGIRCVDADPTIRRCYLTGNEALDVGGGVYCEDSNVQLRQCYIVHNHAGVTGGGVYATDAKPSIVNCVVGFNTATWGGGLSVYDDSFAGVANSIVWGNGGTTGRQIYVWESFVGVNHSTVQGGEAGVYLFNAELNWGDGNIASGPRFVDQAGGNYHLQSVSPCIDAGFDQYFANQVAVDIDSEPRIFGEHVDMGPDEYNDCNANATADYLDVAGGASEDCNINVVPDECEQGSDQDCNHNAAPDLCDIYFEVSDDCNDNAVPDECDVGAGDSTDCNSNGIPDECEPDCNENGVADTCDIDFGESNDCNDNRKPDECDNDCNENLLADECDIADGTSDDCNDNGRPDECELDCNENDVADSCDIADGTSEDCDANGRPDECQRNAETDCDNDGLLDVCQWIDCNFNGSYDACDLNMAISRDCDADTVPDECSIHPIYGGSIVVGGPDSDQLRGMAVDGAGNIFVLGYFWETTDFDFTPDGEDFRTSNGISDIFLSKYGPGGEYLWTRTVGGPGTEYAFDLAVDAEGAVIATGVFREVVDFDPGPGMDGRASNGDFDVFVIKLDRNGDYVWAHTFGGPSADYGNAVTVDRRGDVLLTGEFAGAVDFDFGPFEDIRQSRGNRDVFVLKISRMGFQRWVRDFGGAELDGANDIAADARGRVVLAGRFFSPLIDFDPGEGVDEHAQVEESSDAFITVLDQDGNYEWTRTLGNEQSDGCSAVGVDQADNLIITGWFSLDVDFDPSEAGEDLHESEGGSDVFVLKLNSAGEHVWARTFGDFVSDSSAAIAIDAAGGAIVAGRFFFDVDFNPDEAGEDHHIAVGNSDAFVMRLHADGTYHWTRTVGGEDLDLSVGVAATRAGGVLWAGWYLSETIDLDPGEGIDERTNAGSRDFFVASLPPVTSDQADCDGNLVLDACQIAAGTSEDNNGNHLLDVCEESYCSQIVHLSVRCYETRSKTRANLSSNLPAGSVVRLVVNDEFVTDLKVDDVGFGRAQWPYDGNGSVRVCIDGCDYCVQAECRASP